MTEKLPLNISECPLNFEMCLGTFCRSYQITDNKIRKIKCIFPNKIRDKNFVGRARKYARKNLYKKLLERENHTCQDCGTKNGIELQIHHKKYTNKLEDLDLLCKSCHEKLHILSHHRKFLNKVIDRLGMYDQETKIKNVIKELKQKLKENKYDWEHPN